MIHCWNSFLLSLFHFCTTSSSMDGGAWVLLSFPIRWSLPDVWKAGKRRRCHKRRWRDRISKKRRVQTGKSSIWLKIEVKSGFYLASFLCCLLLCLFSFILLNGSGIFCRVILLNKAQKITLWSKKQRYMVNNVKVGGDLKRKNNTWKMYLARMTLFCSLPQTQC